MIPLPPWVIGIGAVLASIGWLRSTAAAPGPPGPPDPYASQVANRHHLSEAAQAGAGGAAGDLASLLALLRGGVGSTTAAQETAADMGYSYSYAASSGTDYGIPPGEQTALYEARAAAQGPDVTAARHEAAAAKATSSPSAYQVSALVSNPTPLFQARIGAGR